MNRRKLSAFIMTLLIVAYAVPLFIAYAGAQAAGGYTDMPGGIPGNAVQYNKTDVTPVGDMTQVKAGEPALFRYRNMTMLMNCTQNCTLIVTADPDVTPKILGLSVDPNQTMTLTMNMSGSPQQGETVMERTLNFYWGLEPSAKLQLSAQLRLHINQTELSEELNREVKASQLTWMYWNRTQAQWIPVESYMDQNGYVVCNTNHLSTWTVAEYSNDTGNYPDFPGGIPDNAVQHNKTDLTPVAEMEQVKAGEPALFCYRNMTMLMNGTQNCTLVVTADPDVTLKIFRFDMEPNQTMTLTMNMSGSPLQGEQAMERTLNFYLGLEPNAELQLNAQLRLHINQTELNQELNREVKASQLTWMYWNRTQAQWIPVESYMDQNRYLVCNTYHLSTWTVAEVTELIPEFPTLVILPLTILTTLLAVIVYGKKHSV